VRYVDVVDRGVSCPPVANHPVVCVYRFGHVKVQIAEGKGSVCVFHRIMRQRKPSASSRQIEKIRTLEQHFNLEMTKKVKVLLETSEFMI
jgi:hypothetical protein